MIDGEVIALDMDGCIVQWNAETLSCYNCGQTPEEFGIANLTPKELLVCRLTVPATNT